MSASSWQSAFVATTYAIGDSIDDARASLGQEDLATARATIEGLAHPTREGRARALAGVLGRVVADVELSRIA